MSKIWYCPVCGKLISKDNKCNNCDTSIPPVQSKYDEEYYYKKAEKETGFGFNYYNILKEEEIALNSSFKFDVSSNNESQKQAVPEERKTYIVSSDEKMLSKTYSPYDKYKLRCEREKSYVNNQSLHHKNIYEQTYTPKCPVCQSPNIKKLSEVNRAVHGLAFGLFSKTARSQWVCNSCGNKW